MGVPEPLKNAYIPAPKASGKSYGSDTFPKANLFKDFAYPGAEGDGEICRL